MNNDIAQAMQANSRKEVVEGRAERRIRTHTRGWVNKKVGWRSVRKSTTLALRR